MYAPEVLVMAVHSQAYIAPAIKMSTPVLRMVKVLNIAVKFSSAIPHTGSIILAQESVITRALTAVVLFLPRVSISLPVTGLVHVVMSLLKVQDLVLKDGAMTTPIHSLSQAV